MKFKLNKNIALFGITTMAFVPAVAVVSCGSSSDDGLDGLDVLSPALSMLETDTNKTVTEGIISPKNPTNGSRTLSMPRLLQTESQSDTLSLVETYKFTLDENTPANMPDDVIANLKTVEELNAQFLQLNVNINRMIDQMKSDLVGHDDLSLTEFESQMRYDFTFDKTNKTFEFRIYQFQEKATDLSNWIDTVFFNDTFGIKQLTKSEMSNYAQGESYEFFMGGGLMGYSWMNKQYHLNGNYIEGRDEVSTTDPLYTKDFDTFLTNWHGEHHKSQVGINHHQDLERDYQVFGISEDAPKDIMITSKSKMDINERKLFVEFTFHKGGTVADAENGFRKTVVGATETKRRIVEIKGAVPGSVDSKNWEADKARFNSSLFQTARILSNETVGTLLDKVLSSQEELLPFIGTLKDISILIDQKGLAVSEADFATLPQAKVNFQEQLYNKICEAPNLSKNDVLNVGDFFKDVLSHPAQIPAKLTGMTTSNQAAMLSLGYSYIDLEDFIRAEAAKF